MAKTDLSSALTYLGQLPDIRFNEVGKVTKELVMMGFDEKTAKMAAMMRFQQHPDVDYLKSAGVNSMQAAKAMFEANMEIGDIVDSLLQIGYTKDDAVEAMSALNLEEGEQSVTEFTDTQDSPNVGDATDDYADEGYEYDDIPPEAIERLISHAAAHDGRLDPATLEEMLSEYDVSPESAQQLSAELFGKTANIKTSVVELAWRDIGLALQDAGIESDQIITILQNNGASEQEAAAAALPREGESQDENEDPGEGPFGAPSDDPEDLDLGASGDFPYGAGMDTDGPGGLNDSLEGAPGPNDFDATGGGYMGAPDDVADGDFFNGESASGGGPAAEGEGGGYYSELAQDYMANDPQMTKGDLVEILKNEGATKQEANQVAEELELGEDSAIRPGVMVRAGNGVGRVTSVWNTMYGKMANVESERDGKEYEYLVDDLTFEGEHKKATADEFMEKIASHLNGEWYDSLATLPDNYRDVYTDRIAASKKLASEIYNRLASTKDIGAMGILTEAQTALANEIQFCQARLADSNFVGEEEYVNTRPQYEFAREAAMGSEMGPGGGESLVLIAEDMEREAAAINWDEMVRVGAVDFVSNISPMLVGDAQEVARMAIDDFGPRVAAVESSKRQLLMGEFLANVETARRAVVADIKTAKDADEKDKEEKYKKNKEEGMKALQEKRDHEQGKDLLNETPRKNKPKGYSPEVDWEDDKDDPAKFSKVNDQFSDEGWLL